MKNTLILAIILSPLFLVSQEIDEAYLSTLPEGVRDDIIQRINDKKEVEKPIYRRASSTLDKDGEEIDRTGIYGESFFDTIQSSFMPINEPNLGASYILDFGDVLEIQLIGQEDIINTYPIKRDGSISIADIGKIFLSGLTLNKASLLIEAKVKNAYIGTEVYVSLTSIRDISILIAGNAYNPGIYTLNGNSNILHAISMAGGLNDIGSYRKISHIRDGEIISNLDIYDVLIYGKSFFSSSLRSGDTILVNPIGKIVSIESGVLRPGKYELKDEETFEDLIEFANGLNPKADLKNFVLKRTFQGASEIINLNYSEIKNYSVMANDSIFVREFRLNTVKVTGAVKFPGTYQLPIGTTLLDLISFTGGYEDSAYPFGGILNNKNALTINQEAKETLYNKFLNNLIKSATSSSESSLPLVLQQLRDAPVTGRVIAEFDLNVIKSNPSLNTILEDGDEIIVPYLTQQVYVQGEVSSPGAIRYTSGESLSYYIGSSGGVLSSGDNNTIFVVHPNGETQNLESGSRLSFIDLKSNETLIYPGSVIYVPKSSNLSSGVESAAIWAPIISSVALSLTSLSVLNNN